MRSFCYNKIKCFLQVYLLFFLGFFCCHATEDRNTLLWKYDLKGFEERNYREALEALWNHFTEVTGVSITPKAKKRVALKVYTTSGPGLSTPLALVQASIGALETRGFKRKNIFIIDQREHLLRAAGFLPSLSKREKRFHGCPVLAMENEKKDPKWFYESPLPSRNGRKSFLPTPLFKKVDFWINLPMVADHPTLGLSGTLANASLWNISNNERFLASRTNAAICIAEVSAIPELREKWIFTLLTLETYQYIGGLPFHSNYTCSEPILFMSTNPVILDFLMYKRLNLARQYYGFPLIPEPLFLDYSERIGLGTCNPHKIKEITWSNTQNTPCHTTKTSIKQEHDK